ncbi:UbiA prenyltransferase [Chitinispirillum alkaliphilum]|nr:UbiA prenyltransferase [Chitinispirillum alkaliphilum]
MAGKIKKLLDLLFLLRIPLMVPVWTILLLGWVTGNDAAIVSQSFLNPFNPAMAELFKAIGAFSLSVAFIYVVNQIADIESDRINKKLFILPQKLISLPSAWITAGLCAAGGLTLAYHIGVDMLILNILALILGVLYNLPPASLKDRAIGGVAANALGHGMLTFLVGWFVAKGDQILTPDLIKTGLISSLAPAFANGAVFLATTIPDAEGDKITGKKTFCVSYGKRKTASTAALMCAFALLFSFFMEYNYWVMAVPSAISLFFFLNFAITTKKESAFYSFKWPVFLLSVFIAIFVPMYAVMIIVIFFFSRFYYKWRFGIEYPTFKSK